MKAVFWCLLIQVALIWAGAPPARAQEYLQLLSLTSTTEVPRADDGASAAINIPGLGFPFGTTVHSVVYVGTNGYFSFDNRVTISRPSMFTSTSSSNYLVAPFGADINVNTAGQILYKIATPSSDAVLLSQVNSYIRTQGDTSFSGSWMLAASWEGVARFGGSSSETNTFQGVLITNGTVSYAVFIYECDLLEWAGSATIGFKADDYFVNHPLSGSSANTIDCVNTPATVRSSVLYRLSLSEGECTGFTCSNGQCLSLASMCNDIDDCGDGGDEEDCCTSNEFQCDNYRCVFDVVKCNDFDDCGDDSDERGCLNLGLAIGLSTTGFILLVFVFVGVIIAWSSYRAKRSLRLNFTGSNARHEIQATTTTTTLSTQGPDQPYTANQFGLGPGPQEPPPPYPGTSPDFNPAPYPLQAAYSSYPNQAYPSQPQDQGYPNAPPHEPHASSYPEPQPPYPIGHEQYPDYPAPTYSTATGATVSFPLPQT